MYCNEVKTFLRKIVRMRNYLNDSHLTKSRSYSRALACDFISRHLPLLTSDYKAARFIIRHRAKILNVIPGKGARNHNSFIQQFLTLTEDAQKQSRHINYGV